jgi:hypothetical protein
MIGLIWALEAVLLGGLLVWRFVDLRAIHPSWARFLLIWGAGAPAGIGLTACLFFLCGPLLGAPRAAIVVELLALLWLGYLALRRRDIGDTAPDRRRSPLFVALAAAALLVTLSVVLIAFAAAWEANPHGAWDAWAIWNLRARFLAFDPALAHRAWSPELGAITHPEYPLLVSSFAARCWSFSGAFSPAAPAAASAVFFFGLIALAVGGIAALRSPVLGLLAGLVLAASPSLLHEVPAQYADVPLACYFTGAILFALLDRPIPAGVFAGFAAWTKDEGLVFLALFLIAVCLFRRRFAWSAIAGALPVAAIVAGFKLVLARGAGSLVSASLPGASHRLADAGRYGTVLVAFLREFARLGAGWYHPLLPLIALAIGLRFTREHWRKAALSGGAAAALLLAYFGVYILTANDLAWQLDTSLARLLAHVWPLLVLTCFLALRAPETAAVIESAPTPKPRRRKSNRR